MIKLKLSVLLLLYAFLFSCGGSSGDAPDFTTFTDSDMMAYADKQKDKKDFGNAIDNYKKLLLEFPTSNLHIKAQLKIAECYAGLDKWEEQFETLQRLIRENIIPEEVPQLYVQIGKFYERAAQFNPGVITTDSADYLLAVDYYDKALKYPDSDDNLTKSESVYRRALVEAKTGKINDAVARYKMVSNLFPTSNFSILSQMKLKNPNDITELATTDSAITRYKQALGLIEPDEDFEEEQEATKEKTDQGLESTIDALDQDSQEYEEEAADEEYYQEEATESENNDGAFEEETNDSEIDDNQTIESEDSGNDQPFEDEEDVAGEEEN